MEIQSSTSNINKTNQNTGNNIPNHQTYLSTPILQTEPRTTNSFTKNHNQNLIIAIPNLSETMFSSSQSTYNNDIPESSNARNQPPTPNPIPRSFLYSDSVVNEGIQACNISILGKIITDKSIHVNSIQNGLENIWGSPPGLKIQELGGRSCNFS
jgi:hypothetical protein